MPANRWQSVRKSWRAHREIKRYAGGSEHWTVADECVDAARTGAADDSNTPDSADADEPTAPAAPQAVQNDTTGQRGLPQAPAPKPTEPLYLRDTGTDYTKPKSHLWNPLAPYTATNVPSPLLTNTDRLKSLLRDGKIYLSLSDAVDLALENNYDIAIARINLDIADTDILRAKAGSLLRGVSSGLVQNTLGGTTETILTGGGPGATSAGTGGAGAGAGGLVTSTNGGGPTPEASGSGADGNATV